MSNFKGTIFICLVFFLTNDVVGQKEDYQWILENYTQNPAPCWAGTVMDFSTFPMSLSAFPSQMSVSRTNAGICDEDGELMYYTNGISIRNSEFEILAGGDGLNPGPWADNYAYSGYEIPQAAIFIETVNATWLIHNPVEDFQDPILGFTFYSPSLLTTKIVDGDLEYKNLPIIQDSLSIGHLSATIHGNGEDTWVLCNRMEKNSFNKLLFTQDTFVLSTQDIDNSPIVNGVGHSVFSSDGKKYIMQQVRNSTQGQFVNIYDFDRCTGELNVLEALHIIDGAITLSLSVSPNSKYLYVISQDYIYQYDLESDDIESTQIIVAEWDNVVIQGAFPTAFGYGQLAPDGKIYISTNGDTKFMHIIHQPNKQGIECDVEIRGLDLLSYGIRSIPNHPFRRLGPLDDSPCDTLGIDNIPMAGFTWVANDLEVGFTNNSYYEPAEWDWGFEGLGMSADTNAVFTFPDSGTYEVCLTVSNQYGEDTYCLPVTVAKPNGIEDIEWEAIDVQAYPNPTNSVFQLQLRKAMTETVDIELVDSFGKVIKQERLAAGALSLTMDIADIANGIYYWRIKYNEVILKQGKVVKI